MSIESIFGFGTAAVANGVSKVTGAIQQAHEFLFTVEFGYQRLSDNGRLRPIQFARAAFQPLGKLSRQFYSDSFHRR